MKQLYRYTKSVVQDGVDLILPPRCTLSGEIVDTQGMLSAGAWSGLHFVADPYCVTCGIPFEFESGSECLECMDTPPPFSSARAALIYNDTSRDLILGFKHGDKTHLVRSFIPWMQKSGEGMLAQADYLVAVPLHTRRLIARRYNQAVLIADALSKATEIEHLPCAMIRSRATVSQGHLKTDERAKNVKKAFDVHPAFKDRIKDKVIVLIDDVYTTGATVKECTKTLKDYGASEVHILTLARVLKS